MAARAEGFPKLCSGFVWPRWPCSEPVTKILSWNVNQNCTHMFPIMRPHCVLNGNMTFLRYTYYLVFFFKFHKNIFVIWRTCSDKWHERGYERVCEQHACEWTYVRTYVCTSERTCERKCERTSVRLHGHSPRARARTKIMSTWVDLIFARPCLPLPF